MIVEDHKLQSPATSSDIATGGWLRFLPHTLQACALLARWDRPIGIWLLLWPALWGLFLGHAGAPPLTFVAAFIIGAIAMRGAGCTINDILDRHVDGAVLRTAQRPLPAGLIGVAGAWVWLTAQTIVASCMLFVLPVDVWLWGIAAIPLVLLYPLMKRVTWWPQAWLGITFNWGIWLGAASGYLDWPAALCIYIGAVFWTIGYDTIYAMQDIEDDARAGVRSTARLFGKHVRPAVAACYLLALGFWVYGATLAHVSAWAAPGLLLAAGLLGYQFKIWDIDPLSARRAFISNIRVGAAVALMLWLGYAF